MTLTLQQVSLIVFLAGIVGCWALYLVLRDLFSKRDPDLTLRRTLRRVATVQDEEPARNLTGKLDQEFDYLVLESGIDISPVTAFLLLVACGLLAGGGVMVYAENAILATLAGAMGMLLPFLVLSFWRSRRMTEMRESMPYVVDLLARAVRAGESVDQAVALIGSETKGALAKEFNRCARQLELGMSLQNSMRSLSRRVRISEIRMLASTLMVHRQTGGNLPVALDRMSGVIRDRMTAQRQMRATTGAGRSSTLLMAVVSPVTYLVAFLLYPEHVNVLLTDTVGRLLLVIAFALEVLGIIWVLMLLKRQ